MLADELDFVIGVDTHRDEHALALVACPSGARLQEWLIGADERGYSAALARAVEWAAGRRAWAIEGTGSYGKGLARYLTGQGERVLEVERPKRKGGRGGAKSDRLDALRAARSLLAAEKPALPRAAGVRESLRVLLAVRTSAVGARRVALNQLRALLVTCPEPLRAELRSLTRAAAARPLPLARTRAWRRARARRYAARAALARDTDRGPERRGRRARAGAARSEQAARSRPARGARSRADRRRPDARLLVASGAVRKRSRLRAARRSPSDPGLLRSDRPPPARPRWRPQTEQRPPPDRRH